jgi:O-antigen/teichoic acid export membrane protein
MNEPQVDDRLHAVARGGALNLVGAVVYGITQFALLAIVANRLGAARAGEFLTVIVVFNIMSKVGEIGSSTGLIRMISRARAVGEERDLRALITIGVAGPLVAGTACATLLWLSAPTLAAWFGQGRDAERIAELLRTIAPFLPFASTYAVLWQGTRGFDTMVPQVAIEKIAKSTAQVVAVLVVALAGGGVRHAIVTWVVVQVAALVPAAFATVRLLRHAEQADTRPRRRADWRMTRSFFAFSIPRALAQVFQVTILWFDTLMIGVILGTTEAGIYGAGTRYLLLGVFAAESIMQVVGPQVSALLALHDRDRTSRLLGAAAGWQTAVVWPCYLVVLAFPRTLLSLFGDEFVAAEHALMFLAAALLVVAPFGPTDTVILMSGRSRQSLLNTLVAVSVNVAGNLLLIRRYGITAAGAVWAVTIVLTTLIPAWQAARGLGVRPDGRSRWAAALAAVVTVGPPVLVGRLLWGDRASTFAAAAIVGAAAYVWILGRLRREVQLDVLFSAVRRQPTPSVADSSTRRAGASAEGIR